MKHRAILLAGLVAVLILGVCFFGGKIAEHLFVKTEEFPFIISLSGDNYVNVRVVEQTRGLFISGGHGWSLGSQKSSYEVIFNDRGKTLRWQGGGVPITLQSEGPAYYLATFDRETGLHHVDFKCYVWDGAWKEMQTKDFPRYLAVNNLMRFDSDAPVSFDSSEFRWSLLAHFWLCIDSGLPYEGVSHSMVDAEFVSRFRKSLYQPRVQ